MERIRSDFCMVSITKGHFPLLCTFEGEEIRGDIDSSPTTMPSNPASATLREPSFSDFRTPNSARDIRSIHQKAPQSSNGSKGESATNRTTTGRLACDICRESETIIIEDNICPLIRLRVKLKFSMAGKVRCDKAEPKCTRCTRLDYKCSYQGRTRHRASQADLPRQVSELQERLGKSGVVKFVLFH